MNPPLDFQQVPVPRLRTDLQIRPAGDPSGRLSILEDRLSGKCYELGAREAAGLRACDGRQSLEKARQATGLAATAEPLTPEEFRLLLVWASGNRLLEDHSAQAIERLQAAGQVARRRAWLRWTNPISFTLSCGSPDGLLRSLAPRLQGVFAPCWIPLAAFLGGYAMFCLWIHAERFSEQSLGLWAPDRWLPLLVVWLTIKVGHELAHGLVAHRYGARVRDCGLFFVLFFPLAYVDVSSSAKLTHRWKRIYIAAAGMYFELVLAAAATVLWAWSENAHLNAWLHAIVVSAGVSTLLFNANPLMKFDGYYILADLLGIPNLSQRGQRWLGQTAKAWCLGVPAAPSGLPRTQSLTVALYGIAALAWRVLLQVTLTLAAAALFYGLGVIVAVLATGHYWLEPAYRGLRHACAESSWRQWRIANLTATVGGVTVAGWLLTSVLMGPAHLSVPAVVRFPAERYVRTGAPGFVTHIAVVDGQRVQAGQLLIELQNPQLALQVETLKIEIEQARQLAQMARREQAWVEHHNRERQIAGLQQQLAERLTELSGLKLHASAPGIVRQPELGQLLGQYFPTGTALLTLDDGRKELVVAISQDDLASVATDGTSQVKLIFPGLPCSTGRLQELAPMASHTPPAAALTRQCGGPLEVQPASATVGAPIFLLPPSPIADRTDEIQLVTPHIRGIVTVSVEMADHLPVGTTGTVFIPRRCESLANYAFQRLRRWLDQQLKRVRQV
jgi:putative peptide zinc metalloprotease protein